MTKKSIFFLALGAFLIFGIVFETTILFSNIRQLSRQISAVNTRPSFPISADFMNSLANYPKIAGGLILENRCRTLSLEARKEFRWNAGELSMGIARALDGLPTEMQAEAKKVADRTACDEGTRSIVQEASISASAVAAGVGGKPWDIKAYDGKRMKSLMSVLAAQYVDNKCKLMSKDMHDELELNVRRIETTYKTSNPKIFESTRQQVVGLLVSNSFVCGAQAKNIALLGYVLSRDMVQEEE